jgi:hypothetical protein
VLRSSRFLDRSEYNRIRLEDGTDLTVPARSLKPQADGTFLLHDKDVEFAALPAETQPAEPQVIEPQPAEPQVIEPRGAEPQPIEPRISYVASAEPASAEPAPAEIPSLDSRSVIIDQPLFMENVQVERVPINRILDAPAQTRQEGDVTIIPVMEEIVTVQKQILLKEEVRITRRRTEVRDPRHVILTGDSQVVGADGRPIET